MQVHFIRKFIFQHEESALGQTFRIIPSRKGSMQQVFVEGYMIRLSHSSTASFRISIVNGKP
jgi:hypothetical protein